MAKPQYLRVKNLEKYQHYKDRNPPWVKLHRDFLIDYQLRQIPVESRLFFACCLILASEVSNNIPCDLEYLSQRVGFPVSKAVLRPLLDRELLLASSASVLLALDATRSVSVSDSVLISSSSEGKESEKGESFDSFWQVYPRKIGKGAARKVWLKLRPANGLVERICSQVQAAAQTDQWKRDGGKYIPHPATWLSQSRWEDDYSNHSPVQADGFKERMQKLAKGEPL